MGAELIRVDEGEPDDKLLEVVTLPEACQIFSRGRKTILYHLDKGRLKWRKTTGEKGSYLISLQSLIDLYGQPR